MIYTFGFKKPLILSLFLLIAGAAFAQRTVVSGTVVDARTKRTIPFASVAFPGTTIGLTTNSDGKFSLISAKAQSSIQASFVGYKTNLVAITPGSTQEITIRLTPEAQELQEVVVKGAKRKKYTNKNNPAVELIRKVIENKEKNQPEVYNFVEYRTYDKMQFSFMNLSTKLPKKKFFKKYGFVFENQDSTTVPGKRLLPFYLNEKLTQTYYRKNPKDTRTVILGEKGVNFGAAFDTEGIGGYFKHMYAEVNIYDNNIFLLTNMFLSPIAGPAPTFYKYFITDTITTDKNEKLVELSFTPRNTTDMLFEGMIYVTLDGNYAVQKAVLNINKNINLNFVKSMRLELDFEQNPDGRYHLKRSNTMADFGFNKDKSGGLFGIRTLTFDNYLINKQLPDTAYRHESSLTSEEAKNRSAEFWAQNRLDTLTLAESKTYKNIDSLTNMPSYKRMIDIASIFLFGYKSFGKFEIGPASTFYSFNPVEGFRLRLGGRTTPEFSKRLMFESYGAYGFNDERWKFFGSATYSLAGKNKLIYKFPQHYLRASFQRDVKIPGLELEFIREDNFLLSFKRGVNDKYLYNDFYRFDYVRELENHFSWRLGFMKWTQEPAGGLYFNTTLPNGAVINDNLLTTSEINLNLRYAPHEEFYQGKIYRTPVVTKYPIFTLKYTRGLKGVFGGEYNYDKIVGRIDKHFFLSVFGYADVAVEAGRTFGKLPYPLLSVHRANQTFAYNINSYNLMNFMEFVSDDYQSIMIDQHFNGFFFNKIPLLKKLKWREVVSFKALYGGVRDENNPALHPDLYEFPKDGNGQPITYALGKTPYVEGSVGIENIFKFIRVDLVKRFNYLDNPNIAEWGIRARVNFDF
ncbi:MAG: carboxypeptidase-like regulatory domain-containing protein [Sphingobacteriaceae bacterium]|nr:MAG: carboxypeptidase-like regulatory domain-containing protein [Sphingobacteriaceae bacterium]